MQRQRRTAKKNVKLELSLIVDAFLCCLSPLLSETSAFVSFGRNVGRKLNCKISCPLLPGFTSNEAPIRPFVVWRHQRESRFPVPSDYGSL